MNKIPLIIIEIIAIVFGILAIIKLIPDKEIIVGLLSLSFGILAIIWSFIALTSLSKGSSLKAYVNLYLLALLSLVLFSLWHTLVRTNKLEGALIYPEYIFISLAYIIFVIASYKVYKFSKEFGFKEKTSEIKKKLSK
ncbi:hypothetical protein HYX18_04200 [Candidatus Woesearchaeota archaeon]|nr:hypothetical protein [Candidatus Woesearchaeota archaeon]